MDVEHCRGLPRSPLLLEDGWLRAQEDIAKYLSARRRGGQLICSGLLYCFLNGFQDRLLILKQRPVFEPQYPKAKLLQVSRPFGLVFLTVWGKMP
jgi:hypothetical protein